MRKITSFIDVVELLTLLAVANAITCCGRHGIFAVFMACVSHEVAISVAGVEEAFILDLQVRIQNRRYYDIPKSETVLFGPTSSSVVEYNHISGFKEKTASKNERRLHANTHTAISGLYVTVDANNINSLMVKI
jgi:hypothetical protein